MFWSMFEYYGTVELYMLYKMMENPEAHYGGNKDARIDTDISKFE